MTCSPEQLAANRRNSTLSTGPKSIETKEISRINSYKHGLTGEGIVQSPEHEAETRAIREKFYASMKPTCAMGRLLVDRMAIYAARLDRCVAGEIAYMEGRADAPPHFDGSPEAVLAWKYEQAAERGFYRALREFRALKVEANATAASRYHEEVCRELGSSLKRLDKVAPAVETPVRTPATAPRITPVPNPKVAPPLVDILGKGPILPVLPSNLVNFSIGKKR